MIGLDTFTDLDFLHKILAYIGFFILLMRLSLIKKYHRRPPKLTIKRHIDLSCSKTGYVGAFLARNALIITFSIFIFSGLPKNGPKDLEGAIGAFAMVVTFIFLLYHAGLILLVTGGIVDHWNRPKD
jgi:hypothetical protein